MNEAVEHLVEPEAVFAFAIFIKITDLAPVQYVALAAQRRDRAKVRVHRCVHESSVIIVATDISWPIKPIYS